MRTMEVFGVKMVVLREGEAKKTTRQIRDARDSEKF